MSKELEAFNRVWEDCSKLDLDYVSKHNLMDDLREIKQAITPPTADEVCKELIDYFKKSKYHGYIDTAYYSEEGKYFYTEDENRSLVALMFDNYYIHEIPPHLITLIGRFYEGVRK